MVNPRQKNDSGYDRFGAPEHRRVLAERATGTGSNIATFAGAIGGSVGILAILALGVALSIYRRRVLAARRDARERSDLNHDANGGLTMSNPDNAPQMRGAPASSSVFTPRYFPDHVPAPIIVPPPPYAPALPRTGRLLADAEWHEGVPYDRPPPTPPPSAPEDDVVELDAPPPFIVAVAAPIPAALPQSRPSMPTRRPSATDITSANSVGDAGHDRDSGRALMVFSSPSSIRPTAVVPAALNEVHEDEPTFISTIQYPTVAPNNQILLDQSTPPELPGLRARRSSQRILGDLGAIREGMRRSR